MKAIIGLLVACFLLGLGICFGGTIDPNNTQEQYISYASGFPFIAKITGLGKDDKEFFASGVAHKNRIILTAAHVVENTKTQYAIINDQKIKIKQLIIHDRYMSNVFGYYDIAVCLTDSEIGLKWYPDLYTNKKEIGQVCSLSGYGLTGDFFSGAIKSDRLQRAGSNIIDSVDRGLLVCSPGGARKTTLEFLIAGGDSGGGLFIDNKLAGIHSCVIGFGKKSNSEYGSLSGHTRISDHIDWISSSVNLLEKGNNEKKE